MKKAEIESIQTALTNIQNIINKLDYNTSTSVNKQLNVIKPIINNEEKRLSGEIDVNCPQLMLIEEYVVDELNNKMKQLVAEDYKIIDYGMYRMPSNGVGMYIKYTS